MWSLVFSKRLPAPILYDSISWAVPALWERFVSWVHWWVVCGSTTVAFFFFWGYSRRNSLSSQFLLHSLVLKEFSFLLFPFSISIIRSLEFNLIILLAHSHKPSLFYQFSVTVDGKHFTEIVFQLTLSWTSRTKFSKNVCNCCQANHPQALMKENRQVVLKNEWMSECLNEWMDG